MASNVIQRHASKEKERIFDFNYINIIRKENVTKML